jgi:hypothetical protein
MYYHLPFQAGSKFLKIQPILAKPRPNSSKESAWISLDFLFRIEPFQSVALTPGDKNSFSASFPALGLTCPGRFLRLADKIPRLPIFEKQIRRQRKRDRFFELRARRVDSAKRHKLSAPFSPTAPLAKTSTQIQRLSDVILESAGGDSKNCV